MKKITVKVEGTDAHNNSIVEIYSIQKPTIFEKTIEYFKLLFSKKIPLIKKIITNQD